MITDTGMRDGRCKNIGLCLQVLCHEAAIGCTYTAYFLVIDKSMFFTKLLVPSMISCAHPLPQLY